MKKNIMVIVMALATALVLALTGCGSVEPVTPIEVADVVAPPVEAAEIEDEAKEVSYYTGYSHYIDPEEAMKVADESESEVEAEAEENEKSDDSEVEAEVASETKEETKVAAQTETTSAPETVAPASEAVTYVPETTPEPEVVAEPTASTPDMSQLQEWMPPINMLVIADANVVDENGNVLGPIAKGADIGVTGQCPGFYQVNYGAKRSFLPMSVLANH